MRQQEERRACPEVRSAAGRLSGYAAVFDALSHDMGGFRERIDPAAFDATLEMQSDVYAFRDHDPRQVLGRTTAGSLELVADRHGLRAVISPGDTTLARDTVQLVERGELDGMSFAFRSIRDSWDDGAGGLPVRTLHEVELFEVSIVTYPAYPDTDIARRSLASRPTRHHNTRLRLRIAEAETGAMRCRCNL